MAELIDRKELRKFPIRIDHYDKENGSLDFVLGIETVFEYIEYLPTIEAKPVVHAHWTKFWNTFYMQNMYCCSKCGNNALTREETMFDQVLTKYCPFCGAQMELVSNTNKLKCSEKPNSCGVKISVISMEDVPKMLEKELPSIEENPIFRTIREIEKENSND